MIKFKNKILFIALTLIMAIGVFVGLSFNKNSSTTVYAATNEIKVIELEYNDWAIETEIYCNSTITLKIAYDSDITKVIRSIDTIDGSGELIEEHAEGKYYYVTLISGEARGYCIFDFLVGTSSGSKNAICYLQIKEKQTNKFERFDVYDWTYGENSKEPHVSARHGDVICTYSTEENGEYTNNVPTNAGTYWVKAEVLEKYEYQGLVAKKSFEIKPAEVTVTIANKESVYGFDFVVLTSEITSGTVFDDDKLDIVLTKETGTEVGEYAITGTNNNSNYKVTFINGTYTITRVKVLQPTTNTTKFVYTGEAQTYTLAENANYEITNNVQTNVGTYTVTVALKDKNNYEWTDGKTDDLTFSFVIGKATYDMSNAKWNYTEVFTYDKTEKTVLVTGLPSGVSVNQYTNNAKTDAGEYTASVTLDYDTDNYNEISIEDLIWKINKAKVEKPTADTTNFVYNSKAQTYNIAESELYTISDNTTQTEVGTYEITVALKDKANYEWNDGTIDDLTYVFTILDKSLSTGAIVGIAVGSTAVVSGIGYAIWSILKKKKLLLKK